MALATFSRGTKAKLDATKKTDGRIYVTTDTGNMYVDVGNETDSSAQRFLISANGIKDELNLAIKSYDVKIDGTIYTLNQLCVVCENIPNIEEAYANGNLYIGNTKVSA